MRRMLLSIGVCAASLLWTSLAEAQATQTRQTLVVSVESAIMREKPSFNAAAVATLTRGERLEVLETTGDWYGVRVKSSGKTGYVSNTAVQAISELQAWIEALILATPEATGRSGTPATRPAGAPVARPAPAAGTPAPVAQPRAAVAKAHPGIHLFGVVDAEMMTASKSFEAVLGKSPATLGHLGFGVEGTDLWRGLFARFVYWYSSDTGTRVFIDSSMTVHSLDIPLTIETAPIEIGGGWRFRSAPRRTVAFRPYLGGALLMQRYKETSSFANTDDNIDVWDTGGEVFGGLEIGIKFVRIGVEGEYRYVPNAIGAGGASLAFNEKDLGGGVFRLTFGVGF